MKIALFLSPHLDDVAFSCGGTLLRLADTGWQVVLATIFTASVPDTRGFALRCQTDKGIGPEVDYLALRREEDRQYASLSGVAELLHWTYPEAPHRGYESPQALFAGALPEDEIWRDVQSNLRSLLEEVQPSLVFAPQGLGNHVDHLQTIRALLGVLSAEQTVWYRDTPYAIREPQARPAALLPQAVLAGCSVALTPEVLRRKIEGCCRYTSQIGYQFGGPEAVASKLTAFHHAEAGPHAAADTFAETFLTGPRTPISCDHDFFLVPSH